MSEHVKVMTEMLGRPLLPTETVHHRNGVRSDNRPENLELWVGRHGCGQRVVDRVADALATLNRYAPHLEVRLADTDVSPQASPPLHD